MLVSRPCLEPDGLVSPPEIVHPAFFVLRRIAYFAQRGVKTVTLSPVPVAVVVVAVVIAALTDLRSYKVHNALTLPLLVSGLIYHGIVGGAPGLASSAYGAMIGLGLL